MFQFFLIVSRRKFERIASASAPTKASEPTQSPRQMLWFQLEVRLMGWAKTQKVLRKAAKSTKSRKEREETK